MTTHHLQRQDDSNTTKWEADSDPSKLLCFAKLLDDGTLNIRNDRRIQAVK